MNRRLAVLAVAALAAAGAAVPADAARALCLQIQDVTGDGMVLGAVPRNEDALDIVSGDIATGRRNLVAVMRLKSLSAATPVGGRQYAFQFTVGGVAYKLTHIVNVDGTTRSAMNGTAVDAFADPSSGSITWTLPRKSVAGLKTSGAKITGLAADAYYGFAMAVPGGTYDAATPIDSASTGRSYTDGTPTCLKGT